jgi:hypothetical protein
MVTIPPFSQVSILTYSVDLASGRFKFLNMMLDGYSLEIALTGANSAAQSWYGWDQVGVPVLPLLKPHFPFQ